MDNLELFENSVNKYLCSREVITECVASAKSHLLSFLCFVGDIRSFCKRKHHSIFVKLCEYTFRKLFCIAITNTTLMNIQVMYRVYTVHSSIWNLCWQWADIACYMNPEKFRLAFGTPNYGLDLACLVF